MPIYCWKERLGIVLKNFKILYAYWGEITYRDAVRCLTEMGHTVRVVTAPKNYTEPTAWDTFAEKMKEEFDFVFSFDFFPVLSDLCMEKQIPYVAWVYDSPHLTLYSKKVKNPVNRIFLFDRAECERLRSLGANTVFYEPLAVHGKRLDAELSGLIPGEYAVSFVGNLYRDEYNFLDQIAYLPEGLRGYIDGILQAQKMFFGFDLVGDTFSGEKAEEMAAYVKLGFGEDYFDVRDEVFCNMIRKKITADERTTLLQAIGAKADLTLCCKEKSEGIRARHMGYVDYEKTMPRVFRKSRINLNISLRTIKSGIPLRILDILGAGGFLLTDYRAELPEYFSYEKELVWYESPEDLLEKIAFYLPKEELCREIAEAGRKRAGEVFSYEYRLKRILEKAGV